MTTPLRQAYAATTWESPNAIVRLGRSWLGRVLWLGQLRGLPALVWPAPALVLLATVFNAATGQQRLLARRRCRPLRWRGHPGVQGHPRAGWWP
jgi:hypothetical protein